MWSLLTIVGIIGFSFLAKFIPRHISIKVISENQTLENVNLYSGERVFNKLKILNDIGPKSIGSYNNEVKAVNFLKSEFEFIQSRANKNQKLLLEHQIHSGITSDTYREPSEYRNIQNIIMTLVGQDETNSIMVNCHFDSVPDSYGASDDGANCCIMLEILRVLSQKPERQKFTLVFLFNGAEEPGLFGAQVFMENYKNIKNVSAFVNLESTGSGGKEILFQASPLNYWLVEHYRKSVKNPFGQVTADELFKSGLIPAGTDYEIFTNYRRSEKRIAIPGLDFAQFKDGYRYHTKNDHVHFLTPAEMQHTGENMLGLISSLANADEMPFPKTFESAIYFDYLGWFFVVYSESIAIVINIIFSLLAFLVPFIWHIYGRGVRFGLVVLKQSVLVAVTIIIAMAVSVCVCYFLAVIFGATGKSMTWYTSTYLAPGMYSTITMLISVLTYHVLILLSKQASFCKSTDEDDSTNVKYNLNGINLLFGLTTIVITAMQIKSAYIIMVLLLISLIVNIVIILVELLTKYLERFANNKSYLQLLSSSEKYSWIVIHCLGHIATFMWGAYLYFIVLELFIPIAGKSGGNYVNPDILIGIITGLLTSLTCVYYLPLMQLLKRKIFLYTTLVILFISFLIIANTSIGFPYGSNVNNPTHQRHYITHVHRVIENERGNIMKTDYGYYFEVVDFNSERTIQNFVNPNEFLIQNDNDEFCRQIPKCGFLHLSKRNMDGHYLLTSSRPIVHETELTLISKQPDKFKFAVVGKYTSVVSVVGGKINLRARKSTWKNIQFESIHLMYGKEDLTPFEFEVEPYKNSTEIIVTVVTKDSIFENDFQPSDDFRSLVDRMPDWTYVIKSNVVSRTHKYYVI